MALETRQRPSMRKDVWNRREPRRSALPIADQTLDRLASGSAAAVGAGRSLWHARASERESEVDRQRMPTAGAATDDVWQPPSSFQTSSRPKPHQPATAHAINRARAQARSIADTATRDQVLDVLRGADTFLQGLEDAGWWTSSMLLRHFLAGSGKPVTVPSTVLRGFAPAQDAIEGVLHHFDTWFMANDEEVKDRHYGWPTLDLEDGERRVVGGPDSGPGTALDDRVLWQRSMSGAGILDSDHLSDAQASFGGATMEGYGRFVLERHGDTITIAGYIDLRAWDEYKFDPEDIYNPGFRHLEPAGIGRRFELATSPWRVPYFARVRLGRDGRPIGIETQVGDASIPAMPR